MAIFNVSKGWVILVPPGAEMAAKELAHCIAALRGPGGNEPSLMDAAGDAPEDDIPIIVLNAGDGGTDQEGFTWRIGRGRIEIHGDSIRGLLNGVMDFLAALGIRQGALGKKKLPPFREDGNYALSTDRGYVPSG